MAKLELPTDTVLATKVVEVEDKRDERRRETGAMGWLFGSATNKPGNIAGFAIVMFSIMFACVLICGADTPSLSKKDALTLVGGFITLTLGFVFGRTSSS